MADGDRPRGEEGKLEPVVDWVGAATVQHTA